jgi:hypothetical protein
MVRFHPHALVRGATSILESNFMKKKKRNKGQKLESRKKFGRRTFDFIKNKDLKKLLQRDYTSAKVCLKNRLWKPCIILYASIIEAILIEMFKKKKTFVEALELGWKNNIISEQDYHKIHIVRDLRNYVHLHKELKEKKDINEYWAKTFSDICESIIKRFKK